MWENVIIFLEINLEIQIWDVWAVVARKSKTKELKEQKLQTVTPYRDSLISALVHLHCFVS